MLKKLTVWMVVMGLSALIVVTVGSAVLSSQQTLNVAIRLDQLREDYDWVLRLWRYAFYAGLFVFWPALGRRMRSRDHREWDVDDVRGWNGYRYRLIAILIAIDIVIIDQWPLRMLGVLS